MGRRCFDASFPHNLFVRLVLDSNLFRLALLFPGIRFVLVFSFFSVPPCFPMSLWAVLVFVIADFLSFPTVFGNSLFCPFLEPAISYTNRPFRTELGFNGCNDALTTYTETGTL